VQQVETAAGGHDPAAARPDLRYHPPGVGVGASIGRRHSTNRAGLPGDGGAGRSAGPALPHELRGLAYRLGHRLAEQPAGPQHLSRRGGEAVGMPVPAPAADAASGYTGVASTTTNQGIPTVVVSADRNLILTAKIDMRSKDPWATSDRAQAIASGLGGDVLNLTQSGSGDTRSASLTIRVPSSRFLSATSPPPTAYSVSG